MRAVCDDLGLIKDIQYVPIIKESTYQSRPRYMPSRHLETIIPAVMFKLKDFTFSHKRLELEDGDFLDLSWKLNQQNKLIISCRGLEGDSHRHYIKRSAKYFSERGWNYLAWNYRGCGKELNRMAKPYYYVGTDDFSKVINHALQINRNDTVVLIGFSMDGCLVNKYLGNIEHIDPKIKGAVSFSVSCDLKDSADAVEQNLFGFYNQVFLNKLKQKLKRKASAFSEFDINKVNEIRTFNYHHYYTLPNQGFDTIENLVITPPASTFFTISIAPILLQTH